MIRMESSVTQEYSLLDLEAHDRRDGMRNGPREDSLRRGVFGGFSEHVASFTRACICVVRSRADDASTVSYGYLLVAIDVERCKGLLAVSDHVFSFLVLIVLSLVVTWRAFRVCMHARG